MPKRGIRSLKAAAGSRGLGDWQRQILSMRCQGSFISRNLRSFKDILTQDACSKTILSSRFFKYIFLKW
jgi:hypothetical protein